MILFTISDGCEVHATFFTMSVLAAKRGLAALQ